MEPLTVVLVNMAVCYRLEKYHKNGAPVQLSSGTSEKRNGTVAHLTRSMVVEAW